ncbi:MAG: hypothetical protein GXP31_04395 [Kiritimatiellaeota bacterium]|nr:hypothetical protein [Kiritimatiellota bacterium]
MNCPSRSSRAWTTAYGGVCGILMLGWMPAAAGAVAMIGIAAGPRGLTLRTSRTREAPLLAGLGFRAVSDKGTVFETGEAHLDTEGHVTFTLAGSGAADASVTAELTRRPRGFSLDWVIAYHGSPRKWNPWTSGFRFQFAREVTAVKTRPVTHWVRPTGAHPWEVPADTPYPDTECQLREVVLGEDVLVIVASRYDPDWIYGNRIGRAGFSRLPLPKKAPYRIAASMTFLAVKAGDLDPHSLAAEAAGRPAALTLATGRPGNLFEPGETVPIEFRVANVSRRKVGCTLTAEAWDYAGTRVLTVKQPLILPPLARGTVARRFRPQRRGIVFVNARLAWPGGEWFERTTVGILPQRKASGLRPESPFGLAAVIANPSRYPDQFDLDTVLGFAERIGVRWLRGGWYPLKEKIARSDEELVRDRAAVLRQHGILPHVQLGARVPKPAALPAFRRRLAGALEHFSWVSPYIEVGNELNFGVEASHYVDHMLRPVSETLRRVFPGGKVMSMGLGGVHKKWLDAFVRAGGMELIDVLSIHPGCHPRAPEFWKGWRGWVFRPQVLDAAKAAREHGGKEVWITEAYAPTPPGRSGLDLRTAADYLVRTYVCALALGVKVIEWYQFQDGVWYAQRPRPDDVEYNFGIVYTDLTPKPAYIAYGVMTERLEGATYRGRMDLGADDLYGVRFFKDSRPLDVLWSYREKHETDVAWYPPDKFKHLSRKPMEPWIERWRTPVAVILPADGPVTITDSMGNPRRLEPAHGVVALELTGSPIYVRGLGAIGTNRRFWTELE